MLVESDSRWRRSMSILRRSVVLVAGVWLTLSGCTTHTEPQPFQASFALRSYDGNPLPLPNDTLLLIADSLLIDEGTRPREGSRSAMRAVVVRERGDGTREVVSGFMNY